MNILKRLTSILLAVLLGLNGLTVLAETVEEMPQDSSAQQETAEAEEAEVELPAQEVQDEAEKNETEDEMPLGQDDGFALRERGRRPVTASMPTSISGVFRCSMALPPRWGCMRTSRSTLRLPVLCCG